MALIEEPKILTPAQFDRGQLIRELIFKRGLRGFVEKFWYAVESRPYMHNWHLDAIYEHLEAVTFEEIHSLLINVPPGTGKSISAGIFWPAWMWSMDPTIQLLYGSFDKSLLCNQASKVIQILQDKDYQLAFPGTKLASKSPALSEFQLTAGGYRFSTSPGGKGTGRHVDGAVVDDPMKPDEAIANSEAAFKKVDRWYDGTLPTRTRKWRLIIMQRLHAKDLAQRAIDEGYQTLILPMRQVKHSMWARDPRKEPGDLLWPDNPRYTDEKVRKLEIKLGSEASAQLQQDPTPPDGGFVHETWTRKEWIKIPAKGTWVQSWDFNSKGLLESHSRVSGQLWLRTKHLEEIYEYISTLEDRLKNVPGAWQDRIHVKIEHKEALYLLVDWVGGLWNYTQSKAQFTMAQARPYWKNARIKLVELKANGPALVEDMRGKFTGIKGVEPSGTKEERYRVHTPKWEEGLIIYPPGRRGDEVREEHVKFPRFHHDDHVDTTTQALDRLADKNASFRENLERVAINLRGI